MFLLYAYVNKHVLICFADKNECDDSPCSQMCTNTEGSYSCSCNDGFLLSGTSECTDYNECPAPVSPCDQQCTNTIGSYKCSCNDGFILDITSRTTCNGTFNSWWYAYTCLTVCYCPFFMVLFYTTSIDKNIIWWNFHFS